MIADTFTHPNYTIGSSHGLPKDRLRKYQTYFKDLGVEELVRRDDGVILFTVSAQGFLTKGSYKGYAYSAVRPTTFGPRSCVRLDVA